MMLQAAILPIVAALGVATTEPPATDSALHRVFFRHQAVRGATEQRSGTAQGAHAKRLPRGRIVYGSINKLGILGYPPVPD
jgi:hypothetical protein